MTEARIGRVFVASLHQAIADILPNRLEFYENWLHTAGLRHGTIGLAPLSAVLSFLRREGDAYGQVTTRAGEYAGLWTVRDLAWVRQIVVRSLPPAMRTRAALKVGCELVRTAYQGSRAVVRLENGTILIDIRGSLFCEVREPTRHPLCSFYPAAFMRVLELLHVPTVVLTSACRATGGGACVVSLALAGNGNGAGAPGTGVRA
jgi:hypothetical protein